MLSKKLLQISKDQSRVFIQPTPVSDPVDEVKITELLNSSIYKKFKVNDEGVHELIKCFTQASGSGSGSVNDSKPIMIAERLDAKFIVEVDPDEMFATVAIQAAYGGVPVSKNELEQALLRKGVVEGILATDIERLLEVSENAKPGQKIKLTVARGKPAENGEDSRFERLVATPKERLLQPQETAGGKVDMRDLGGLVTVKKGAELMRKHPCIPGAPGYKVTGETLSHEPGKEFPFALGDGTDISPEDPDLLIATQEGLPSELDRGMFVDDVLLVDEVNVGFGHIEYDGSVVIAGNIGEGMRVIAKGDVVVGGFIESAYVEVGCDLVVTKGIVGHRVAEECTDYSCTVKVDGNLSAKFAQYSSLHCEEDVQIFSQLLHCGVTCAGHVRVADEQGFRGTLLGGKIIAGKGLSTMTMGAQAGGKTEIWLEGELQEIEATKNRLKAEMDQEQQKLNELQEIEATKNRLVSCRL